MEVLKISSKSNPNSVAGAIAGLVKESNKAEMQASNRCRCIKSGC